MTINYADLTNELNARIDDALPTLRTLRVEVAHIRNITRALRDDTRSHVAKRVLDRIDTFIDDVDDARNTLVR